MHTDRSLDSEANLFWFFVFPFSVLGHKPRTLVGQGFPLLSLTLAGVVELLNVLDPVKLTFSETTGISSGKSLDSKAVSACENHA